MRTIDVNAVAKSVEPVSSTGAASNVPHKKPDKFKAVLMLVGAVIYLVSPLDLLPDVIPGLCHIDDAALLGLAIQYARKAFS